ncbi:hypothetical protein G0Q06_00490 [Puniceicoccales bacterium CK1056]|uniref:Uncharacterized protein n=1 Tax=Oceanipulchritudo coccoides TaxID=2706888 RepID=A0A6B2LXF0_9BACT|nr:hypothetical protein [Oceanipulchritudo coccoides]NDV60923.1 hypothetical protein [Oceanipulchritudo coccoides]
MWLATQHGFYSIVQKAPQEYHIRARFRNDLDNLLQLCGLRLEVHCWEQADYRYRIIANRKEFLAAMASLAIFLDYPNFKSRIAETPDQREKLSAFHEIWHILAQLQKDESKAARR